MVVVVVVVVVVVAAVAVVAGPVAAVAVAVAGAVGAVIVTRPPAAAPGVLRAQCVLPPAVTHSATLFVRPSRSAGALILRVPWLQFD